MNIVIAAVGGQGALFAARVIGKIALSGGYDVKVSEVHGMSQRGGSVITHVRYGKKINSPIVEEGFGDAVIAFELLEGARCTSFLHRGGVVIANEQHINPQPVLAGDMEYPRRLVDRMRELGLRVRAIDALTAAKQAGNVRAVNAVMLGMFAAETEFEREAWHDAIRLVSPPAFADANCLAFDKGFQSGN